MIIELQEYRLLKDVYQPWILDLEHKYSKSLNSVYTAMDKKHQGKDYKLLW